MIAINDITRHFADHQVAEVIDTLVSAPDQDRIGSNARFSCWHKVTCSAHGTTWMWP